MCQLPQEQAVVLAESYLLIHHTMFIGKSYIPDATVSVGRGNKITLHHSNPAVCVYLITERLREHPKSKASFLYSCLSMGEDNAVLYSMNVSKGDFYIRASMV